MRHISGNHRDIRSGDRCAPAGPCNRSVRFAAGVAVASRNTHYVAHRVCIPRTSRAVSGRLRVNAPPWRLGSPPPQGSSLGSGLCCPGPSSLSRPHPSHSRARPDFAAWRLIRDAFAVRERLGEGPQPTDQAVRAGEIASLRAVEDTIAAIERGRLLVRRR